MKRIIPMLCLGLTALVAASGLVIFQVATSSNQDVLVAWNTYEGESPGHYVQIRESEYASGRISRIVHIYPADAYEAGVTWPHITGHDYDGTFSGSADWDRIFRCGFPDTSNGCNSITFVGQGNTVWKPSPADEDNMFLELVFRRYLPDAQQLLTEAMVAVYNSAHLIQTLESFREQQNAGTSG